MAMSGITACRRNGGGVFVPTPLEGRGMPQSLDVDCSSGQVPGRMPPPPGDLCGLGRGGGSVAKSFIQLVNKYLLSRYKNE